MRNGARARSSRSPDVQGPAPKSHSPAARRPGCGCVAHVNSYGAWPHTPERYEATIALYSGSDKIAATSAYKANVWNRVEIDVSSWEKRSEVTRIEITYTVHLPDTTSYDLMFDLDAFGFDV